MSKTNKELAVEVYSAFLIARGSICSNPNFQETIIIPNAEEMAATIAEIADKLSAIEDN